MQPTSTADLNASTGDFCFRQDENSSLAGNKASNWTANKTENSFQYLQSIQIFKDVYQSGTTLIVLVLLWFIMSDNIGLQ